MKNPLRNMMQQIIKGWLIAMSTIILATNCKQEPAVDPDEKPKEIAAKVAGNLAQRLERNFSRLETGRYLPDTLYDIPNRHYHEEVWPGDLPGRLILSQTLLQSVSGRQAKYLKTLIEDLPNHFNEKGYMGKIYKDVISEQQLSGHGWLLRGLCEYYLMTNDPIILGYLKTMATNLILPTAGYHKDYPIDPALRKEAGGFMGTQEKMMNGWLLSSDVGCDFIFMDGVIQTYSILKTPELKAVCYEMADRFLEADLYNIKAQTHATLTALRGLIRLYELTGEQRFIDGAVERYDLYRMEGMTENYENFNWFQRPEWTEPCAIVDSYQVSLDLWKQTGQTRYLEDAQLIWYNAISYAQRDNGGFGLSNCTGPVSHLETKAYEAHWCCTMRGSEGIAERTRSLYFNQGDAVIVADFQNSEIRSELSSGTLSIKVKTDYPFDEIVELAIKGSTLKKDATIKIFLPSWIENIHLTKGGKVWEAKQDGGYLLFTETFETGDTYHLSFNQRLGKVKPHGNNTPEGQYKIHYGPLVLGIEKHAEEVNLPKGFKINKIRPGEFEIENTDLILRPVYHLMDSIVNPGNGYRSQILFSSIKQL
ncbi:MAG: glycoside hydrolase family 127 protein [Cyclobacteriaceae bacterium]